MSLRSRLTGSFLTYVGTLGAVLIAVVIVWAAYTSALTRSGAVTSGASLLERLPAATHLRAGKVTVAPGLLADVAKQGAFLQVLDAEGRAVFSFRVPAGIPDQYPPGLLVYAYQDSRALHFNLSTWYETRPAHWTWVLGTPVSREPAAPAAQRQGTLTTVAGCMLLATLAISLFFGWRLGTPLLHILGWLERIARGDLDEPKDRNGIPRSISGPGGPLRPAFRIYREVLESLDRLVASLRRREADRRQLERAREEWIGGVSHDIKTPLAAVQGYAALLAAPDYSWAPEEVQRFGAVIARQATYLDDLLNDLSLSSRLRSGEPVLERAVCDLVELTRRAVIDLVNNPLATGRDIHFDSPSERIDYPVDRKLFTRALENLVANAAIHNPEGTVVEVRVEAAKGGEVRIAIRDDGVGMDPETKSHMFERYYRGTDTKDVQGRGSGLGCAIAKELVEAHGGRLTVETAPGAGTLVEIWLPAV